ncbi:hypothetical protein V494_03428 [Pseudogymnoascus sp. VKM F-4513 (FW-928)]|nr:hypothetical protein V494_03428 [Pseudogymnoascus sp. VKM F-4513 (FW-928)]
MEKTFMEGKKHLVKRDFQKSEVRRDIQKSESRQVEFHEVKEPESSDHSTIVEPQQDETVFMNDFDEYMEDRSVKQVIALGCDVSVSKKVVSDTLDRIEQLGQHPAQPGRTARVEIFYFISHIMQSHSRQMLIQQASNPFKNPRHMAVVMTRLMELYLASNPSIRFLIITFPMHHLSLMLALRDHIGVDVFKVVTIIPAPPFGQRTSSLLRNSDGDSTTERKSPTKPKFNETYNPLPNPFLTPDQPSKEIGKPDFVLYTTSPQDTVERVPIRIDLLIEEIEGFVNPPEDFSPVMAPRPAISWGPEPTGLPHPLSNITRASNSKPLEPIDLDAAVRYQTSKLMAKYQYQRLKRFPGAPPRTADVVNAQWEHTYKKVYREFRKIKLARDRGVSVTSLNPSDDEKADDEGDPGSSDSEIDVASIITFDGIVKDDTGRTAVNENPFDSYVVPDDASVETIERHLVDSEEEPDNVSVPTVQHLSLDSGGEPDNASVPTVQHLSIDSDAEPNSAGEATSPSRPVRKKFSFELSMSYSFEMKAGDRQSGFWETYAQDHI